jgi:predicted alpha/beta-fold hydrolase
MTRRELLSWIAGSPVFAKLVGLRAAIQWEPQRTTQEIPSLPSPEHLQGTAPLTTVGDQAARMVEGIREYLARETAASVEKRQGHWHFDHGSPAAYEASVAANRERFKTAIGLIDKRVTPINLVFETTTAHSSFVAATDRYKVYSVRWSVLDRLDAEGLLLQPNAAPIANVVALPDADWSPEMIAGLAAGVPPNAQFARLLAEQSCSVLIPTLINRECTWSANPTIDRFTNLTHREYIYRMSYELGRHPIGFEVQKVLAAVDWFQTTAPSRPIAIFGYGEGGLLALYSAACDTRISVTAVSGYFQARENVAAEPLYRNIWTLLQEFGDAELSWLIAPRVLIIEGSRGPEIAGPPQAGEGRSAAAAAGSLVSPPISAVHAEFERAQPIFRKLGVNDHLSFVLSGGEGRPGSQPALEKLLKACGGSHSVRDRDEPARDIRVNFDPSVRLHRQFTQTVDLCQHLTIESEAVRKDFWAKSDASSVENWERSVRFYKNYLWEDCFGKLPQPSLPLQAQTRKIYDETGWTGYEVSIPLWPEVFAFGILLLPKPMRTNERRPVVVCQHGLEGRPEDLIKPDSSGEHYYHRFAADLADHGFVVYCPQNPYIGGERFRTLQRMANPLKLSLFSFILSQHERTLDWLVTQPFVDPDRIGFYGLSYGGKTAVRVPPLLDRYALSICAGDFNEWIWKVCRDDAPFSYVFTPEYEVPEFNLGNRFNHSEMASLMTPRPFMVERGHDDGVSIDSWVAYEYAKVRRHYDLLGLSNRTEIEYFKGPHTIHGVGTFAFLYRFLNWSEPFDW